VASHPANVCVPALHNLVGQLSPSVQTSTEGGFCPTLLLHSQKHSCAIESPSCPGWDHLEVTVTEVWEVQDVDQERTYRIKTGPGTTDKLVALLRHESFHSHFPIAPWLFVFPFQNSLPSLEESGRHQFPAGITFAQGAVLRDAGGEGATWLAG
jgi:hypothetical protein